MSPTGCNKCRVYNGFYCFCVVAPGHGITIRWGGVTFLSHAWGIRPITTHQIAGQSEHASLLRTMSFVKIDAFQKAEHRGATIMYSMWKIMCFFFYLKPHKNITLHQIHEIMFFLATSYGPFNEDVVNIVINR